MALYRPISRVSARVSFAAGLRTALVVALAAVAGGVLLGLFSAYGDRSDATAPVRWLANIPGPWVLFAFALGILAGARIGGSLAAVVGLAAGVATYYAYLYLTGERPWLDTVEHAALIWGAVAIAAGCVFGWAGASWRLGGRWSRILSVALLCGVLIGESILVADNQHAGERLMIATEALFAVLLLWTLLPRLRDRVIAAALTLAVSAIAVQALIVFSDRLRDAGL